MMGKKSPNEKNIQVVVRCRPRSAQEIKDGSPSIVECAGNKEICVHHDHAEKTSLTKTFGFDQVFAPDSTQIDVYRYVGCPLLEEVLLGYNCTVFAYGQTGTGKTYTMEGEKKCDHPGSWNEEPEAGVIPRAMQQLFEKLEAMQDCEYSVRVSFLEIYNEELFDLLAPMLDSKKLRLYEDSSRKGSVVVQGLEEVVIKHKDEVYDILDRGRAKRQTAATLMNAHSSRSHSLFSVTVHIKESSITGEEMLKIGKLNLVDLAGSENVGRSGAVDKRLREAGTINQSLLALGRVITALVERAPHVPYRESKLTRLLQDSLGGRTKTSIIATISPASCNLEETLSTLDYAHRAKNILNRPEINQKLTKKALIKEFNEEIDKLKKELLAAREKDGVFLPVDNYQELQNKLKSRAEEISATQEKLSHLEEEFASLSCLFSDTSSELSSTKDCLHNVNEMLQETKTKLKRMVQDRDGLQFLVDVYQKTEEDLYNNATTLLTVFEKASSDCDKLHSKLERKKAVDERNAEHQSTFRQNFAGSVNILQEKMKACELQHNEKTKDFAEWIDSTIAKKREDVHRQTALFEEKFKNHQETLRRIKEQEKINREQCGDWKDCLQEASTAKKNEMLDTIGLLKSDDFLKAIKLVKETLRNTSVFLKNFPAILSQNLIEPLEKINLDYHTHLSAIINHHQEKLHAHFAKQSQIFEKQMELQKKSRDEHKRISSKMSKMLTELMSAQEEVVLESSEQTMLLLEGSRGDDVTVGEDTSNLLSCVSECSSTLQSDTRSHVDMAVINVNDQLGQAGCQVDMTETTFPCIENISKDVACRVEKTVPNWDNLVQYSVNDHCESTIKISLCLEESTQVAENEAGGYFTDIATTLATNEKCHQTTLTFCRESVTEQDTSISTRLNDCEEQLKVVERDVDGYFNGLSGEVPTGTTPARRQYSYPVNFSRTGDHELLLSLFNETYEPPSTPKQVHQQSACEEDEQEEIAEDCDLDDGLEKENENNQLSAVVANLKAVDSIPSNQRSPLQTRDTNQQKADTKSKLRRPRNIPKTRP